MNTITLEHVNRQMFEAMVKDANATGEVQVTSQISGTTAALTLVGKDGVELKVNINLPDLDKPDTECEPVSWDNLATKIKNALNGIKNGTLPPRVSTGTFADLYAIFSLLLKVSQKLRESSAQMLSSSHQQQAAVCMSQSESIRTNADTAYGQAMFGAVSMAVMTGISTVMTTVSATLEGVSAYKSGVGDASKNLDKMQGTLDDLKTVKPMEEVSLSPTEQKMFLGEREGSDVSFSEESLFKRLGGSQEQPEVVSPDSKPDLKEAVDSGKLDFDQAEAKELELKNANEGGPKVKEEKPDLEKPSEQVKEQSEVKQSEMEEVEKPAEKKVDDPLDEDLDDLPLDGERDGVSEFLDEWKENGLEGGLSKVPEEPKVEKLAFQEDTLKARTEFKEADSKVKTKEDVLNQAKEAQLAAKVEFDKDPSTANAQKYEDACKRVQINEGELTKAKTERADKAIAYRDCVKRDVQAFLERNGVGKTEKAFTAVGRKTHTTGLVNKVLSPEKQNAISFAEKVQKSVDGSVHEAIMDGSKVKLNELKGEVMGEYELVSKSGKMRTANFVEHLGVAFRQIGEVMNSFSRAASEKTTAEGQSKVKAMDAELETHRARTEKFKELFDQFEEVFRGVLEALKVVTENESKAEESAIRG